MVWSLDLSLASCFVSCIHVDRLRVDSLDLLRRFGFNLFLITTHKTRSVTKNKITYRSAYDHKIVTTDSRAPKQEAENRPNDIDR